jgi:hypothetical protein
MSAAAYIEALLVEKNKKAGKGDGKRVDADGFLVDKNGKRYRLDASGRSIYVDGKGKDIGQPLPALPPVKPQPAPDNYEGWTKNDVPYNGPQYNGYPLSRSDYVARVKSNKPLPPPLVYKKPRTLSQRELREAASAQRRQGTAKEPPSGGFGR